MALTPSDRSTLADWDATETRDRIRARDVTAMEVVEAAIERAERARHLGAVLGTAYDRARKRAGTLDPEAPLCGVPTFIKDLAHVQGVPTTWGSRGAGPYVARKTDPVVARFEDTGLVTLGKSACPELGLTATTEPLGSPPCRNPWDTSRSTGGSSGGAASLVAAGVVPIAHANDGGGSIRIPAACCGLVGLKPSRFRFDMRGANLLPVNIACEGVVTRTVRDTVAFFSAVEARRSPRGVSPLGKIAGKPLAALRLGVFVDAPIGTTVHPEVRDAVLATANLCRTLGHEVDAIPCPFDGQVIDDFLRYWGYVAWVQLLVARFTFHWGFNRSKVEPWTSGLAATFSREKRLALSAMRRLRRFSRTYAEQMQRYDVLVSPVVAEPAPALGYLAPDLPFDVAFERIRAYAAFTPIQNASGAPAISLPLGRSAAGLPIGVQLAAAHGGDRLLLELALSLEAAQPWALMAPPTRP